LTSRFLCLGQRTLNFLEQTFDIELMVLFLYDFFVYNIRFHVT